MLPIIGIIPARYASTRFPGKPLADIAGRPMIQHVYERASRATLLSKVLVATDDQRIYDAVEKFGGEAMMTDAAHQNGSDRLAEVITRLPEYQLVVNIQGDEPLINPATIDQLLAPMLDDTTIVMCSVMTSLNDPKLLHDANTVKVVTDLNGFALYFSRAAIPHPREAVPGHISWHKHVGLYAYRRDFLLQYSQLTPTPLEQLEKLEQLRVLEHGYRIKMVNCPHDMTIGVDTPEDLARVREIIASQLNEK